MRVFLPESPSGLSHAMAEYEVTCGYRRNSQASSKKGDSQMIFTPQLTWKFLDGSWLLDFMFSSWH